MAPQSNFNIFVAAAFAMTFDGYEGYSDDDFNDDRYESEGYLANVEILSESDPSIDRKNRKKR